MSRTSRRLLTAAAAVPLLALPACGGLMTADDQGQNYPSESVTLTAPSEPGSGWDTTARALTETLKKESLTDSPVPVQNRPGATGCVWMNTMVSSYAGDPNQIAVTSLPSMSTKLRGECEHSYRDVTMIARIITEYYMTVAPADSPYNNIDALLNAVKDNPQEVPIAASGDDRLPFALLVEAAGGNPERINFVNYEGGGQQIQAMLNGDVEAAIAGVSEFRGQIEAGTLRGLVVLRDESLDAPLNEVPTTKEMGYDVTLDNWRAVYGPPDMPDYAVEYWQQKLRKAVQTDTWQQFAKRNQWGITYMKGAELDRYLNQTNADIRKALKETGEIEE